MNAPLPSSAPVSALSPAQHKAALWADAELQVFAVLMGSRLPDLPAQLAAAQQAGGVPDFDCLLAGALPPQEQRRAPYLVQLKPDAPFTDWLLFEAAASLGDWGVVVRGPVRLLALRNHLRELLKALTPDGQVISLDWMDPEILLALLPRFDAAALPAFFGPVQSLTIIRPQAWHHAEPQQGQLILREVPLLAAAA